VSKIMMNYLFSAQGRLPRSSYWLACLIYGGVVVVSQLVLGITAALLPGSVGADGERTMSGLQIAVMAIPSVLIFGAIAWSGLCVAVKRAHDRDRSGWFVLVQLIPIVGSVWFFVEAGCLRGTVGSNRFGPDPLLLSAPGMRLQPAE
jgi:uncharacterized membrane protein YhaH (DUF805 family)